MMRLTFWAGFWTFMLDQTSKYFVVHWLDLRSLGEIDVWPPFLNFRMAWNRGINFGLFSGDSDWVRWLLIALALAICLWVIYWVRKENFGRLAYISAGILVGGALGNVLDRILYGAVADFLNMSCCGFENPFSFNVADVGVFVGAFGLIFFTGEKKPEKKTG
jgi:signal peptidase II